MLRTTEHAASVFPDSSVSEGSYKSVYKAGTTEEIAGQMGEYYQLASGGYIKKASGEVLAADAPVLPGIARITSQSQGRTERFVLEGAAGLPYWIEDLENETRVTFYGDLSLPEQIDTGSRLFSSIDWTQNGDGSLTVLLRHADSTQVWAVDVLNTERDTVLYARRAPALSETVGRPLEDVSVVLDPGHGGADPGALSVLGMSGPAEKELNLANALALKMRLEQLGATVHLTREGDDTLTLYERMELSQEILPDFYLSLHHNSVAESVDAYLHGGVESYYYDPLSALFGEALVRHIANANYARGYRFANWSYYTVTRMRYTQSVLCEIAFMPNPVEYRHACDSLEIYKTANAIAAAMHEVVAAAS
jgi:N-acetylmuramoyl-L-alanine amidase